MGRVRTRWLEGWRRRPGDWRPCLRRHRSSPGGRAEKGAAGALIIHDTEAAAYPFSVVQDSNLGERFDLVTADKNMSRSAVEGWINNGQARSLLMWAGQDYEVFEGGLAGAYGLRVNDPGFVPDQRVNQMEQIGLFEQVPELGAEDRRESFDRKEKIRMGRVPFSVFGQVRHR